MASADATAHVLAARTYDLTTGGVLNVADTTGGCLEIVELDGSTTAVLAAFTATEFRSRRALMTRCWCDPGSRASRPWPASRLPSAPGSARTPE